MKSLNKRLVIIAIALGGISLLIASIAPDGWNGKNEAPNFIDVALLAEKIKNREDLQLIDIRPKEQFDQFHLPTAINIPFDESSKREYWEDRPIVFYSGDDWLARRLWNSLDHSQRERSLILYGGAYHWYDRLLYPKLPVKPRPEDSLIVERIHDLTVFYGGSADFVKETEGMNYYRIDLSVAPWPKPNRQKGLTRKGC